jgi:hypothetical protein
MHAVAKVLEMALKVNLIALIWRTVLVLLWPLLIHFFHSLLGTETKAYTDCCRRCGK